VGLSYVDDVPVFKLFDFGNTTLCTASEYHHAQLHSIKMGMKPDCGNLDSITSHQYSSFLTNLFLVEAHEFARIAAEAATVSSSRNIEVLTAKLNELPFDNDILKKILIRLLSREDCMWLTLLFVMDQIRKV